MGETTDTPKSFSKASTGSPKFGSIAYAYRHWLFSGFGVSERRFWRANQYNFRATFISLCAFQFTFNFYRMSLTFYIFLTISNTLFCCQNRFVSITFSSTSADTVHKPKRRPKNLSKCPPKSAAEASRSAWNKHRKRWRPKIKFLRPVLLGRFTVFEPKDVEMRPRLYIDKY